MLLLFRKRFKFAALAVGSGFAVAGDGLGDAFDAQYDLAARRVPAFEPLMPVSKSYTLLVEAYQDLGTSLNISVHGPRKISQRTPIAMRDEHRARHSHTPNISPTQPSTKRPYY